MEIVQRFSQKSVLGSLLRSLYIRFTGYEPEYVFV